MLNYYYCNFPNLYYLFLYQLLLNQSFVLEIYMLSPIEFQIIDYLFYWNLLIFLLLSFELDCM